VSSQAQIADAYRHCEAVTRTQAANFFYGIRLLPGERRRAMCAVYAFARRVDDIGDGDALAAHEKLRLLDGEAGALAALAAPGAGAPSVADPVMVALADAQRRFPLSPAVLAELIEGVRMDLAGTEYESFEELVVYCRRVAGAIGRVCLAIFGLRADARGERARAEVLADELGVALQLTNILRDVREDAQLGRVYLPSQDLRRFGVVLRAGGADGPLADPEHLERLSALVRFECGRACEWFDRGIALTPMLDRRSAACVLAMAGIYRRLLERIDADPGEVARRRMSLPAREKAWVAARGILGVGA
jgi:phytoene synthase